MSKKYYYDFHIHSCLSPCSDEDMTPANIAGMASIKGLNVLALTDHNSCKNCPAFFDACENYGIVAIAGVEVTTAEDVHVICLFEDLNSALDFDKQLENHRIFFKNDEEVFGTQIIVDSEDNIIGREENLLINATTLDIDSLISLAKKFNALVYPAHIDREANGIVSILGTVPEEYGFSTVEFHNLENTEEYIKRFPHLRNVPSVVSSDAHHLWDISEAENFFEFDCDRDSVRKCVFEHLRGKRK